MSYVSDSDAFDRDFSYAIHLVREEKYEEAIRFFDKAIARDPVYAEAYAERAAAKWFLERFDDAFEDCETALEINPSCTVALACRAKIARERENYDDALTDLNQALDIEINDTFLLNERGFLYKLMERYEESAADFDAVLRQIPDNLYALYHRAWTQYFLGKYDEALRDNDRLLEYEPTHESNLHQRSLIYFVMQHYEDAVNTVDKVLPFADTFLVPLCEIKGESLLFLNRPDEALAMLTKALENDTRPITWYDAAVAHGHLGQLDECRDKLQEAAKGDQEWANYLHPLLETLTYETAKTLLPFNPDRAMLQRALAIEAINQDNYNSQEVLRYLDESIAGDPTISWTYYLKMWVLIDFDVPSALVAIEQALQLEDHVFYQYWKGCALWLLDRNNEAFEFFDTLIKKDYNEPAVFFKRGRVYYDWDNYELAIADIDRAIELLDDPTAVFEIGVNREEMCHIKVDCYRQMKQYDKAIKECSRILYYSPDYSSVRRIRGYTYFHSKQYAKSLDDFQKLLEIEPELVDNLDWCAWNCTMLSRYDEAFAYIERGLQLDTESFDLLFVKGYTCRQLYRFEEAEETFTKAYAMQPEHAGVISHLATIKSCLRKDEEALKLCQQVSMFENGLFNGYVFLTFVDVLVLLDRVDEAIDVLRQSIEKYPDQKMSYALLAELYEERNEPELAKQYYESALQKPFTELWEPEECYNLFHGVILAALGDHETAIAWILEHQSDMERAMPFSWSDYWLARSYFALDRMGEAKKYANRAIQLQDICNDWQSRRQHSREMYQN